MIDFDRTIFYQFANFIILLVILNFFLFKPVLRALAKREEVIQSRAQGANQARDNVEDLSKRLIELTREKQKPILETKDTAIAEAHTKAGGIIEQARSELSQELTRIKGEIETQGKRIFETLKSDVDRLSREAVQKVLKRSV
jgi:F-type H+-transporting ATPase subunit b